MNLIRKLIEANESKMLWFVGILIGSYIPMILRFIVSIDSEEVSSFDIKDCLFASLAMNLSNFNLIGEKGYVYKVNLAIISAICILVIAFCVGVQLTNNVNAHKNFRGIKILAIIIAIFSIGISYNSSHYSFK